MVSARAFRLLTTAVTSAALVSLTIPRQAAAVRNASASTIADLTNQSMGDMPAVDSSISVDIRNGPSIRCAAGEYPADCYPVGTLTDLGVGELTLNELGQRTGYDSGSVTLVDFELMEWQTVGDLAKVVPELRNYKVRDVAPINEATGGQFSDKLIGELPAAAQAQGIPTYGYSVRDIPNLANTTLSTFRDASRSTIRGVPGLGDLKFSQYPQGSQLQAPAFAMVDVAYGHKETNRRNTITGSVQERSWNVPCDKNCSYLELANLSGAMAAAAGVPLSPFNFHGAQYIGGDTAKLVKGGWVGEEHNWPGYGYEPHGQLPFGDQFKISVSKVSEPDGSAVLRANARYCQYVFGKRVACTPYGVEQGRLSFPFLKVREKGLIPVATVGSSPKPQDAARVATSGGSLPSGGAPADGGGGSDGPTPAPVKQAQDDAPSNATKCSGGHSDPLPGYRINSGFGMRWGRMHKGIDKAAPSGTPIKASRDGVIAHIGRMPNSTGWGNYVGISHPCDKTHTLYAHMSRFGSFKKGQAVKQGQIIGYVGSTGRSTGPHLHFEFKDPSGQKVNPRYFVRFN